MRGGTQRQAARGAPHLQACKPSSWELYFGADAWQADDRRHLLIADLVAYFASPPGWQLLTASAAPWHARVVVELDWQELLAATAATDLATAMQMQPGAALGCLACAAYEALFRVHAAQVHALLPAIQQPGKVVVRLVNHPQGRRLISQIKADAIGKLVSVCGTVVRATAPAPVVTDMEFVCGKCGEATRAAFPDGRYTPPDSCPTQGCRGRVLTPQQSSSVCMDWQRISLQGLPKDEKAAMGRVPVPIAVELTEDLVGSCAPGDVATVVGIVKVMNGDVGAGKKAGTLKAQCLFLPYIDALSVVVAGKEASRPHLRLQEAVGGGEEGGAGGSGREGELNFLPPNMPSFSHLDLDFVCKFTEECEGDQLRQLVLSLCPTIWGNELVKAGLLLALLGGVRKIPSGENDMALRGDIHVLIVGDPGLGKSQLLQAAAAAAPRGVYICGNTSSAAGLTATVVRENGEFAFDAGALVLADRGVCCIDEFDKMSSEHQALLGAMEQQEVTVAKAGMVASLPARTTVLAAANPVEGSYNKGRTLQENLKISLAMLSRFDLIFLLLDRPDADRDKRLTEHVLAMHSGVASRAAAARSGLLEYSTAGGAGGPASLLLTDGSSGGRHGGRQPLLERLRARRPDDDPLPQQLLRKYIAYVRQYVHPRLTPDAIAVLKAYYLQLRAASAADPGALPVTARQLESLVRLSEARARVELREEVTREDAEDVVEILKQTLDGQVASGGGDLGLLDFTRATGSGRAGSQAAERRRLLEALGRHCQAKGDVVVEMWEIQDVADRIVLQVPSLHAVVGQLNESGKLSWDLLKKGGNKYQVCGVAARGAGSRQEHSQSMGSGLPSIPASSQLSAGSKRSHQQMQPPLPMQVPQALQQQQFQQQHDPALPPGWW
ncbi:hypothetical protein ABPG77_003319 [Micractinium sp. CCAP 211/92]